jgi:hypothetical protein
MDTPMSEPGTLLVSVYLGGRAHQVARPGASPWWYDAVVALVTQLPDQTQAEDIHVDRLVDLIQHSLAHGGCSNCGGLPHTTTCRVGRLAAAFQGPALVTHTEDCRKVRCRNTNDAICALCACTCRPSHPPDQDNGLRASMQDVYRQAGTVLSVLEDKAEPTTNERAEMAMLRRWRERLAVGLPVQVEERPHAPDCSRIGKPCLCELQGRRPPQ